ncbi:DUF1810 domain-containing protein [Bosea sp. PAMC 26642]|uniref:DUF1810 domain-containing protein n=1 Tax=Bosea sp. (strain PAMC 26642) TaxID=1792307 RepID=UPI00077006B7|nr:DUF1810 domain-containing protein [Bosea sp. PAMC 26642]AMJ63784.1 calpastatin [Bosea sp. PAMC 26642]
MADMFDLDRFVIAQNDVFAGALAELEAGQKRSHWMWFIFPQLRGLGISPTAQHFGIANLAEAKAYLAHPLLGRRLITCTEAVLGTQERTLHQIFGSPDDMKFGSSMTLFAAAGEPATVFRQAIDRYCDGKTDARTIRLLEQRHMARPDAP